MRKVRACTYALLACVCFFLNLNCERTLLPVDSNKKIDYEQADTKARVTLKVFDMHSMAPISGAKISITGVDSSLTDSKGTVIFNSIKPGDYIITCSKAGFEEIYDQLSITLDSNSNTVPIVNQSSNGYLLAKKGAAVRGNIYYKKGDKYFPANGTSIECELISPTGQMFQNRLRTTSSTNGTYIFANLPEYTDYKITVRPYSNGTISYTQKVSLTCNGKSAGDTIRANDIVLEESPDGVFLIMSHNLKTYTKSEPIVLEFSEAVDTSKIGKDSISVFKGTGISAEQILIQKQWQNNNKKLVITPFDGTWDPRESYSLNLDGFVSIAGKQLGNSNILPSNFSPITSGALGNVMNVTALDYLTDTLVNYNTNSITLNWSPLANALNYQIYQKRPIDSSWIFLKSVSDTFTSITTASGSFQAGKQLKYIVLGENSTTTSPLNTATALTVKDQMPPTITNAITEVSISGFDNTYGTVPQAVYIPSFGGTFSFSEPMDTTIKPVLDVFEGSDPLLASGDPAYKVSKASSLWMWTGLSSGRMLVLVDEGKDGSNDTLKIDFTGLTDIAGNKFDTTKKVFTVFTN